MPPSIDSHLSEDEELKMKIEDAEYSGTFLKKGEKATVAVTDERILVVTKSGDVSDANLDKINSFRIQNQKTRPFIPANLAWWFGGIGLLSLGGLGDDVPPIVTVVALLVGSAGVYLFFKQRKERSQIIIDQGSFLNKLRIWTDDVDAAAKLSGHVRS